MDELLQNLEQATNPDPNVQSSLAQYINLQIENPDFGEILFEILENDYLSIPPQILSICCNILKLWAKVQWEHLDFAKKCTFFESLKKLLMNDHPVINDLSIVFIDIASHSISAGILNGENSRCYESHIYDFFNRISANPPLQQLHALTNIIFFISRKYKRGSSSAEGSEPTLLFTRVCNVFIPLFEYQEELIETAEGCEILSMTLSIFKAFFFNIFIQKVSKVSDSIEQASEIVRIMLDKAVIPINFAQTVLSEFSEQTVIDFRLVARCCNFLNSFYKLILFDEDFSQISSENNYFEEYFNDAEEILQLNFSVLSFALEVASSDTFLIPSILKVFETFRKFLPPQKELLDIILSSSRLTPVDREEFFNSPNIFYLNVYEEFKDCGSDSTPQISRSIIYLMVKKNYELLLYMLSLPIEEEHLIRCISYCLPLINRLDQEDHEGVLDILNQFYVSLLQFESQDPIFIAARLHFICNFVPFLPDEQRTNLMEEIIPPYFSLFIEQITNSETEKSDTNSNNSNNDENDDLNGFVIIMLITCELFKRLLSYDVSPFSFEESLQALVTFHSYCFTPIVIDSIRLMVFKEKGKIIPFAESILDKVFISLEFNFSQFLDAAGDPNQIETATDSISSNLSLCSMLIESSTITTEEEGTFASSCLIKPELLSIIQVIFENEITDCCEDLVHFLSVVYATDSSLIIQFTQLWFCFAISNEWVGFIDQLIEPFFSIISNSPDLFNELNVTEQIEEICLSYLVDPSGLARFESVHKFATLISWICLIDLKLDVEPEIQLVQLICGDFCSSQNSDSNIVLVASLFDVMASLTVSRKILPSQSIFEAMIGVAVKENWIVKVDQKRLYSIFILTVILLSKDVINSNQQLFESLLFEALKLLNQELKQRNLGDDEYFTNLSGQIPPELEFLFEEVSCFNSPQEKLNVAEILVNAVQLFHDEFIKSLKKQFSEVFSQLL